MDTAPSLGLFASPTEIVVAVAVAAVAAYASRKRVIG